MSHKFSAFEKSRGDVIAGDRGVLTHLQSCNLLFVTLTVAFVLDDIFVLQFAFVL